MKQRSNKHTITSFYRTALFCCLGLWNAIPLTADNITVNRLRTEAVKNPVGIDVKKLSFSWTIDAGEIRGVTQTAYEVAVYSDVACTEQVWTSGRVESDKQIDIPYEGNSLQPSTCYYWNVTVWDNKGNEASSTETACFETGLLDSGWDNALWIKATTNPLQEETSQVPTHYSVETDFEIENLSAGIIFAGTDQAHYLMWQINLEAGYPRFRPHIWRGSALSDAACLAEIDLRSLINVEKGKSYQLRIEVDGKVAKTYIDNVLIDTREHPDGENYTYGVFGIRQDRALFNYNDTERAYFDNFVVKDLDNEGDVLISEDFSNSTNPFNNGSIKEGRLFVEASYAWYTPQKTDNYDIDMDFIIERDNAGIIFSAYDINNLHLWGINIRDKATPFLRRHHKVNGGFSSSDVDLGAFFTKAQLTGSLHHLKISVKNKTIYTYIDGKLVDTYQDNCTSLHNGLLGFRTYHDTTMDEKACYDNVTVTTYTNDTDDKGTVTFSEDFEGAGHAFSDGVICIKENNKMLCVNSTYEENCNMQTGTEKGIPLFRKAFTTKSSVKSAKIYASALGVFDLFLNGQRVGLQQPDGTTVYDELKPGWTDYRKEICYMSYDVTSLMREGDNVVGAQVSNGWWGGPIAHGVYGNPSLGFIAKLRIEYTDGTIENMVTNTDWACSQSGPVLSGDIYNGETYDARRESNWSTPEYDASNWCQTAENTEFKGNIIAFNGQTVRTRDFLRRTPQDITVYEGIKASGTTYGEINVTRTLGATEALSLKAGETAILDMGQNMVGWIHFTVKGATGTRLRFKFGEMLNDNGDAGRANDGPGGSLYTYNLRTADATLNYIMKGSEEGETFQPSTTFFGFRFCEITATSDVTFTKLTGEVVGSDIEESASFETSHPDVNQLYSNIQWGQRGNFLSIPTDCPQRDERLGWTADTQIFARAACYNADTRAFYHKWMRDLRNSQNDNGAYPDMAPFCNFWGYGNAAWGDAGVIVPWTVYVMFGDKRILEDNYISMTRYMNWLATLSGDGYTYNGAGTGMGDWLAYENTDARFVSVCYYAYVAELMSKIAQALSKAVTDNYDTDAQKYATLHENIKAEFQKRYLNGTGQLTVSTQTSYLLALKLGLLPDSSVKEAVNILENKFKNNGYKLSTGFVGTGILNQTLSEVGLDDVAYNLLLQRENPSWLYSIDQGATTIWERWDSYTKEGGFNKHPWIMNSFNHYAYGVVSEWMFRNMGGIETDEEQPGFKHIILQPTPDMRTTFPNGQKRITETKVSHHSGYGLIRSEWQYREDGRITYTATVPANTTATLYLPVLESDDAITESGKPLQEAEGVTFKGMEGKKTVIELQSGTYLFNIEEGIPNKIEKTADHRLNVHPNPFQDMLHFCCTGPVIQAQVTSSNGQIMCIQSHGESINTTHWPPGIYIVDITTKDQHLCKKVIKQ